MINMILSSGPYQPQQHAITTDTSRSVQVQPTWFTRKMSDNTARRRQWLSYSVSAQRLFCVTCMAFGGPTASQMWASTGCSDWAHIVRDIERHETSADHQKAEICRFQWLSKKRLSDAFDTQRHIWNEQVERNRRVVSVMIDAIKYLAKEQMALRGHDSCSGKFYNLFALLAQYDSVAGSYMQLLRDRREDKLECNLISAGNQRRLLSCIKALIQEEIIRSITNQAAFSLIYDGTTDTSRKEACSVVLRFVEMSDAYTPTPKECLIDVFSTGDTSAANLEQLIVATLEKRKLDWTWLMSQSYDGASNVWCNKWTAVKNRQPFSAGDL